MVALAGSRSSRRSPILRPAVRFFLHVGPMRSRLVRGRGAEDTRAELDRLRTRFAGYESCQTSKRSALLVYKDAARCPDSDSKPLDTFVDVVEVGHGLFLM